MKAYIQGQIQSNPNVNTPKYYPGVSTSIVSSSLTYKYAYFQDFHVMYLIYDIDSNVANHHFIIIQSE